MGPEVRETERSCLPLQGVAPEPPGHNQNCSEAPRLLGGWRWGWGEGAGSLTRLEAEKQSTI